MAESEDYYRGMVEGLKRAAKRTCEACDYEMPIYVDDPNRLNFKHWMHGNGPCEAPDIHFERAAAEKQRGGAYLDARYGRMWQRHWTLKRSFHEVCGREKCYCCHKLVTRRIDANVWGTVCEYDVCDEHAEQYDGKCLDEVHKREEAEVGSQT